jgi:hypothetical protein
MANAPSPNDLTRQQLDELDALLQRMLAMPPAVPEPIPAAKVEQPTPPAGWRADRPPAVPAMPTPHLAAVAAAVPEHAVFRANPFAFAPTPDEPIEPSEPVAVQNRLFGPPTPDTGVPPSAPEPVAVTPTPAEFRPIELKPAPAERVPPPVAGQRLPPPSRGVPAGLWPLFATNWVIEKLLGLFGPPGMALTTPGVKYLLGVVGILLMGGAAAWTARGVGWVKLPVP